MKQLIIFVFVLISINGLGQGFPATQSMATPNTKLLVNGGLQAVKGIINGVFTDTSAANSDYIDFYNGAQIYTRSDRNFWLRDSVSNSWVRMARYSEKLNISDTASMLSNYLNNVGYGLLRTGQTARFDSATVFPQLRATIPTPGLNSVLAVNSYSPSITSSWTTNMNNNEILFNDLSAFTVSINTNDWRINGNNGGNYGNWIQSNEVPGFIPPTLDIYSGNSSTNNTYISLSPDSLIIQPGGNGKINIDSLRVGGTENDYIVTWTDGGMLRRQFAPTLIGPVARVSIALTTTGTSGVATYNNTTGILNVPNYGGASAPTFQSVLDTETGEAALNKNDTINNGAHIFYIRSTTAGTNDGLYVYQNDGSTGFGTITVNPKKIIMDADAGNKVNQFSMDATSVSGITLHALDNVGRTKALDLKLFPDSLYIVPNTSDQFNFIVKGIPNKSLGGTDSVLINDASGKIWKVPTSAISGSTPTLQQVFNQETGEALMDKADTINMSTFQLRVNGSYSNTSFNTQGQVKIDNTSSGTGLFVGSVGKAIVANSTGNNTIEAYITGAGTNYYADGTTGLGLWASMTTGRGVVTTNAVANNSAVRTAIEINADITTGTAGNHIGSAIQWRGRLADGTSGMPSNSVISKFKVATSNSVNESEYLIVSHHNSAFDTTFRLLGTGQITFDKYTSGGSFVVSDTTNYKPAVFDANGVMYRSSYYAGGGGYTNLTQFVAQNNWKMFYSDGIGDVQELSVGAAGSPLYSVGTTSAPSFFAGVTYATSGTNVLITTQNTTDVGLNIKGISSQSANLLNISSSSGTGDLASITKDGYLTATTVTASSISATYVVYAGTAGLLTGTSDFAYVPSATNMLTVTGSNAARSSIIVQNLNSAGNASSYWQNDRGSLSTYAGFLVGGSADAGGNLFGLTRADRSFLIADGATSAGLAIGTLTADDLIFGTNNAEAFRVLSTGQLKAALYGSGTFTGTAAKWLAVTAAGLIIEENAPGGSGITIGTTTITSGTSTKVLYNNGGVVGEYTLTGTGTVVVMATSPTIATPKINQINDANGNELFIFTSTGSAVNELTFNNAATGTNPGWSATGGDADIGFNWTPKAAGKFRFLATTSGATEIRWFEDLDNGSNYAGVIAPASLGSDITITLPNASSTLPIYTQQITYAGPSTARTITYPDANITVARTDAAQTFTGSQSMASEIITNTAVTASGNAATVAVTASLTTVTNNSAATLTITLTTASAVDGQVTTVRVLDFSAAAQTITWVNTENSSITAPTTSNGSTTLFLTVKFIYNSATSKWRCIGYA